jgi:hypothetical protein
MFDLNDVEPIKSGELLPDGSFIKVTMAIRAGGIDGETEIDRGLLKASNAPGSDVLSLDCEFTVLEGPYARRRFWHIFTIAGGKVDDKGASIGWSISKRMFRAMIDSALGLDPEDISEVAKAKRQLRGLSRSQWHQLRRQGGGRAEQRSALSRSQPPRPPGAADREGVARGDERRGRPAASIERTRRKWEPQRGDRPAAGVGQQPTQRSGGDAGYAAVAAAGRTLGSGSAACAAGNSDGEAGRPCLAKRLKTAWITDMTDDAWQAHVKGQAAREIGRWLEATGRLHWPIAALGLGELECMASAAISRFIVLATERICEQPQDSGELAALLYPDCAPSAAGRPGASATPGSSASTVTPATASARCAASTAARRWPEGATA